MLTAAPELLSDTLSQYNLKGETKFYYLHLFLVFFTVNFPFITESHNVRQERFKSRARAQEATPGSDKGGEETEGRRKEKERGKYARPSPMSFIHSGWIYILNNFWLFGIGNLFGIMVSNFGLEGNYQ